MPVTNCKSRVLFSLSISRTNWNHRQCNTISSTLSISRTNTMWYDQSARTHTHTKLLLWGWAELITDTLQLVHSGSSQFLGSGDKWPTLHLKYVDWHPCRRLFPSSDLSLSLYTAHNQDSKKNLHSDSTIHLHSPMVHHLLYEVCLFCLYFGHAKGSGSMDPPVLPRPHHHHKLGVIPLWDKTKGQSIIYSPSLPPQKTTYHLAHTRTVMSSLFGTEWTHRVVN